MMVQHFFSDGVLVSKDNIGFLRVLTKCDARQRKAILQTADNELLRHCASAS